MSALETPQGMFGVLFDYFEQDGCFKYSSVIFRLGQPKREWRWLAVIWSLFNIPLQLHRNFKLNTHSRSWKITGTSFDKLAMQFFLYTLTCPSIFKWFQLNTLSIFGHTLSYNQPLKNYKSCMQKRANRITYDLCPGGLCEALHPQNYSY